MKNGVFFHSYGDVYQRDVQRDIVMETFPLRGVSQFDMLMEEIERDGSRTVNIINEGGDKIWEFLQLDSKRPIEKLEKTPTVIRCNNKLTMQTYFPKF